MNILRAGLPARIEAKNHRYPWKPPDYGAPTETQNTLFWPGCLQTSLDPTPQPPQHSKVASRTTAQLVGAGAIGACRPSRHQMQL